MSWRDRLRVSESNAEIDLTIMLQSRGLLTPTEKGCVMPSSTVIVFKDETYDLVDKHQFTLAMAQKYQFTIPDRIVLRFIKGIIREVVPFYLDGPPHQRNGVRERDERINAELISRGVKPRRFSYVPKISKRLLTQIADEVQELMT